MHINIHIFRYSKQVNLFIAKYLNIIKVIGEIIYEKCKLRVISILKDAITLKVPIQRANFNFIHQFQGKFYHQPKFQVIQSQSV